MAADRTDTAVRPVKGVRQFREQCRLAIRDGALVATDYRGRSHRFALDGSAEAPSEYLLHGGWWSIVDQRGQGLVRGTNDEWDSAEIEDLAKPAGITHRWQLEGDPPELRPDGVVLQQSFLSRWAVPLVGGGSGLALAAAYLLPIWVAAIYFVGILGLAAYAWQAGALAPARRSKSTAQIEAHNAQLQQEQREKYGPAWEPPVSGRWRLAVEWQVGLFFLAGVVLVIKGEYGPAAVMPVISALFFFFTRYVFPGVAWTWWMLVVLGHVMAVAMLLGFLSMD